MKTLKIKKLNKNELQMSDTITNPLTEGQLQDNGVLYVEDPRVPIGSEDANDTWRVEVPPERGVTLEQKADELKNNTELAEPLIDVMAEIQETKRSLAEIWYEQSDIDVMAPERSRKSKLGNIASSEMVDGEEQLIDPIPENKLEGVESIMQKREARKAASESRPKWEEYFPKDSSPEEQEKYEKFISAQSEIVREHVEYLRALHDKQEDIIEDTAVLDAYAKIKPEQYVVMHNAGVYGYCRREAETAAKKISNIRVNAHLHGRSLSSVEEKMIARYGEQIERSNLRANVAITNAGVQQEVERRLVVKRAEALRNGFVETEPMKKIIDVVLPRLAEGLPAAFFGEVGGAKSSLARHISREYLDSEPVTVDCGPDITMQALFGKTGMRASADGQGSETYDTPGSITRAAMEGKMVVLDEYDTLSARIRTACNGALLWRTGQTVRPFGMDQDIVVKPGFCIVITANLRSDRYDREKLDLSTIDRFEPNGAGIFEIHYPDSDIEPGSQAPEQNLQLAIAALTDDRGDVRIPPGMIEPGMTNGDPNIEGTKRLINFVNAAHMIQRLFSDPTAIVGHEHFVSDSAHLTRSRQQGKPVLEQAVLSPRGMLGILRNLTISGDSTTLSQELARWVAMQPAEMDRKIVSTVLATRGLLYGVRERDLKIPEGTLSAFTGSGSSSAS